MRCEVCRLVNVVNRLRDGPTINNFRGAQALRSRLRRTVAINLQMCPRHRDARAINDILAVSGKWLDKIARELSERGEFNASPNGVLGDDKGKFHTGGA